MPFLCLQGFRERWVINREIECSPNQSVQVCKGSHLTYNTAPSLRSAGSTFNRSGAWERWMVTANLADELIPTLWAGLQCPGAMQLSCPSLNDVIPTPSVLPVPNLNLKLLSQSLGSPFPSPSLWNFLPDGVCINVEVIEVPRVWTRTLSLGHTAEQHIVRLFSAH